MKLLSLSCTGRRNGQYSHHLGGNVGVRVTLRVAIMSTTGEWPECDQGDGALLALACKWDNSGPSAPPPVAAGGRNCMWKGSHSYSYKLTVMVSGRDTGAPKWHHESRGSVTAGPGLAPVRGQWQLGEPQGALQQEWRQVHEGWEVSREPLVNMLDLRVEQLVIN